MRTLKKTSWALALIACALSLNSCNADNDDNVATLCPTALVTVYRRSLKLPWQQVTPANQRYRAYMVKK